MIHTRGRRRYSYPKYLVRRLIKEELKEYAIPLLISITLPTVLVVLTNMPLNESVKEPLTTYLLIVSIPYTLVTSILIIKIVKSILKLLFMKIL